MLSPSEFCDFVSETGVVLRDGLVGKGGNAQSRLVNSGDSGGGMSGRVIPRTGNLNGDRKPEVALLGEEACEVCPLLFGVSSFGMMRGRSMPCVRVREIIWDR